jgi:hypothetical protein
MARSIRGDDVDAKRAGHGPSLAGSHRGPPLSGRIREQEVPAAEALRRRAGLGTGVDDDAGRRIAAR